MEYTGATEKVKNIALTKQERQRGFWYLVIMATSSDRRRQGLAGRLMRDIQMRAQADNHPIWLEATTWESKALYLKHGFQTIEEINMGKGVVDSNGRAKTGGEGITIWGMLWRPEKAKDPSEVKQQQLPR